MADEIINRVANSALITINLEDFYPEGERVLFDIKQWLYEGLILKEKDFRLAVNTHNWSQYQDTHVALNCSTDAIIPAWAFMLLSTHLEPYANNVVIGNLEVLETSIYQNIIETLDASKFRDASVIIKGCSNKPIPPNAYVMLTSKLRPFVKSMMYGEACSAVPLYKKAKK